MTEPILDVLKSAIPNFRFCDFNIVEEINFIRETDPEQYYKVKVKLSSEARSENYSITIQFIDVRNLRIKFEEGMMPQIMGLEIGDVREKGWEKIFWEVRDYESDVINFFCREIHLIDIQEIA